MTAARTPVSANFNITAEPIEVTRSGLFGGPVDHYRKFIPGVPEHTVTVRYLDGRDVVDFSITADQAEKIRSLRGDLPAVLDYAASIVEER